MVSDAVIVASIGALAGIVSAAFAGRANHNAKRSREQVENDHSNNFREENDERHAETLEKFKQIFDRFTRVDRSIGGVRDDIRQQRDDHGDLAERVHDLEKIEMTNPRERKPK